jgi:hypothetical protein
MNIRSKAALSAMVGCLLLAGVFLMHHASTADEPKYSVEFAGGHDYDKKRDLGRPVVLIAAALDVPPDVFREAFSGVTPAKRGGGPTEEEARKNKAALMKVLKPHGVMNERLDEVSNFYRFRQQNGELWRVSPAKAHAVVENGKITRIVVDEPGYGYSTPPTATVRGIDGATLKVTIRFAKDLKKNGAVESIELGK